MQITKDEQSFNEINSLVVENGKYVNDTLDNIINQYSDKLDTLMQSVAKDIIEPDDVPTAIIERYLIELSSTIFFVSSKVEHLGVFESISKVQLKEKYNNLYLDNRIGDNGKSRTVAELTSIAEEGSKNEVLINDMYGRAYKTLKTKIDAAETINSTLSKILSHRMQQEQSLSMSVANSTDTTRVSLNEQVFD